MRRYIATFFRGVWIYLLVLVILLPASGLAAFQLTSGQYQATARIWVDKPLLANVLGSGGPAGPDPADEQGNMLAQLLKTDSFMSSVLKQTKATSSLTGVPEHDGPIISEIRENLFYGAVGPNTVEITYIARDPELTQQVVQQTIEQFRNWTLQSRLEQTSAEAQYYQKQLTLYEEQMVEAKKRLDRFIDEHPTFKDPKAQQSTEDYLELTRLQREYDGTRQMRETTMTKLDQASLADSLSNKDRFADFRIIDEPTIPQSPTRSLKKLMKFLIVGFGASFGLVLATICALTWMDRAIRTQEDLVKLSGVPVVGVIPTLRSRSSSRKWRPNLKRKWRRSTRHAADMVSG